MSQTPINVTYPLEVVLAEIKDSINTVDRKLDTLQRDVTDWKVEQGKLIEKAEGIDNRLKAVEGTQKNQVWTLIILLAGAIATAGFKTFFLGNTP